jgi:DNA-binding XRE family transcriptional regulator
MKLTVKECAEQLKVDAKTLHGWEKREHQPALRMAGAVIDFLG